MIEIREDKEGKAYKQLKAVSRQPLINFVNLKSNTIMKKPRCKDTLLSSLCQDFSMQLMLTQGAVSDKICFRTLNYRE